MGWKQDARRLIVGEQKKLSTLPGYWVKPRKYSIQAKDEINAIQRRIQKGINKKELASLMQKVKEIKKGYKEGEAPSDEEMLAKISEGEFETLLDAQNAETKDLTKVKIFYGVEDHNFDGASVAELAQDILDYEDVALEILGIVEEFNRPLAMTRLSQSETSPDGSTPESSLTTATSSLTDESQPNS